MEKLDELLVDCTPKEVAKDSIYGINYYYGWFGGAERGT